MNRIVFQVEDWGFVEAIYQEDKLYALELPQIEGAETAITDDFGAQIVCQVREYFRGERQSFDLPIHLPDKQPQFKRAWQEAMEIPYGTTATYGDLGLRMGNRFLARVVGNAMRHNPLPLIVPCHRVLARGGLGGFAGKMDGYNIELKERLLALETENSNIY